MAHILLVEDEINISSFIMRGLQEVGYNVAAAYDGEQGWELSQSDKFDMLILDIIMPKLNGFELCSKFRDRFGYKTPILMLTALGTTEDIVKGLRVGADDYLVKPFSFQELEARIEALLRRLPEQEDVAELKCADLILNCKTRKASRGDSLIDLTVKEYGLLEYFMNHQKTAISRLTLLKDVWDKNFDTNTNVVDVYVNYLRTKIDKNFEHKLIHTVVGIGYMMSE
jgi:DNA-binding response OmpR family regulator